MTTSTTLTTKSPKVACKICGKEEHILVQHILKTHAPMTVLEYIEAHGPTLWSSYGAAKLQEVNEHNAKVAHSVMRPRKKVPWKTLFPTFGRTRGVELKGEIEIFESPGPLTPKLDPFYVFPEEETMDLLAILFKPERNRVYVKGWSGTGKTQLFFNLAALLNYEIMELSADDFLTRSDLVGSWMVKNGETIFNYGIIPQSMRRGVLFIINEIDTMLSNLLNMVKPVLEDPARLTILENGAEVVTAHQDFRAGATANTWSRGDNTGLFGNTHVQSDADVRRWNGRILLDYLKPEIELEMLARRFEKKVKEEELEKYIKVANKVRDAFKAGRVDKTFSPAELINWCENTLVLGRGVHHSARISFLNSVEPDVNVAITEMVSAVFGQEVKS